MFGRKKRNEPANAGAELLPKFIDHQFDTERMKDAARASERTVAILKPQIPIRGDFSAGWFGGNAALPEQLVWPERDGQKMLFVGQINLAALPRELWSGVGPRAGWIALFLPGKGEFKPTILHIDGPLVDVKAPPPNEAAWARNFNFNEPKTFALPRWPIEITSQPGSALHASRWAKDAQSQEQPSLLDAAYQPFDRETLYLLLDTIGEAVSRMAKAIVRFPSMKKLRPEDTAWFERQQSVALETFVRFFEIEGRIRATRGFDQTVIPTAVAALADLAACDYYNLQDDDGTGFCEVELREPRLIDPVPARSSLHQWWQGYDAGLRNHALAVYTNNSEQLPREISQRLEQEWSASSSGGIAAMGHAPLGHIYTPHGPDSPNEVLLELHTNNLTGWIWGDCYSLVLLIERAALSRGDFSKVTFDITN